jgi:hypothetical protein
MFVYATHADTEFELLFRWAVLNPTHVELRQLAEQLMNDFLTFSPKETSRLMTGSEWVCCRGDRSGDRCRALLVPESLSARILGAPRVRLGWPR